MIDDDIASNEMWDQFLETWPIDRVRAMSLQDYSTAGAKDTFTYWIESKLDALGSIWGGSSFKFGIYSRNDSKPIESNAKSIYTNDYAWYRKYGETQEEAFRNVRNEILVVIESVISGDLSTIDDVDLGFAYKWKIAFHYQDRNNPTVIPIFKLEALLAITQSARKEPASQVYKSLIQQKEVAVDLLEYGRNLWSRYSGMATIWKVSHGKDDFSKKERTDFLDSRLVVVHGSTKKGQGVAFANEMNPGDYFFLCHGNDEGLVLFGRITSEATGSDKGEGWLKRSYEVIKELSTPKRYQGIQKGWAPNYNSTVKKVKLNELDLFEEHILQKYFGLTLAELDSDVTPQQDAAITASKLSTTTTQMIGLNTIYYGPPGTGKTYKILTEIAEKWFVDRASIQTDAERAMALVENSGLTWWQVITLSLLDIGKSVKVPELAKHPILKAKIASSSSKQPQSTISKELQMHSEQNCPNVNLATYAAPFLFWKDEESSWSAKPELVERETPELLDLLKKYQKRDEQVKDIRYVFTTFHQSFSYEDFVEGIKPVMDTSLDSGLSYQIESGIFKRIAVRAQANREKAYAIFIDEINRGNVASIFGELITLIEPDKRLDGEHEVQVTLPYSKERFGVPPNLHIIGTMNTADRSIVALDSALRRRFKFEACFPEPELIAQPDDLSVDLQELLRVINQRITMLIDRDHTIGHSYFMNIAKATNALQALRDVFRRNVVPLLEEYFAGDLARVGMVLGERFVQPANGGDQAILLAPGDWDIGMETKDDYVLSDVLDLSEEDFASIYESP